MELQFEQDTIRYLCRTAWGEKTVEETGEIRLPEQEKMPDVILGAWGQPLLMEKEWAGDSVTLSGGVNVWVLLRNSEEKEVHCVEGWVPFRQVWELQDSRQDGKLWVQCALRGADARMTGAGKLIVTVQVSVGLQALEPCALTQYKRGQLPEDVYTLEDAVSFAAPVEAGEKRTFLEEDMVIPSDKPELERVLFYSFVPEVSERRIMGDKLVFRGAVKLHLVYKGKDGTVCACDGEFPVSQYIQLDGEYGDSSVADVLPVVTSAEVLSPSDNRVAVKCGLVWQYMILDTLVATSVLDAYSNTRTVDAETYTVKLAAYDKLDAERHTAQCVFAVEPAQLVEHSVMPSCWRYNEKNDSLEADGMARILYYDGDGLLQGAASGWTVAAEMANSGSVPVGLRSKAASAQVVQSGDGLSVRIELPCYVHMVNERRMEGISALKVSDECKKKEGRPSLIVRRADGKTLWQLAKECNSSQKGILEANSMETFADDNRMLLIPVE